MTLAPPEPRVDEALQLAIEDPELPVQVRNALNVLLEKRNGEAVDLVRLAVAASKLWQVGADEFVRIVAYLAIVRRSLPLETAAAILASCPLDLVSGLGSEARNAIEVATFVEEDERDGVMSAQDDDLLERALRPVLAPGASSYDWR